MKASRTRAARVAAGLTLALMVSLPLAACGTGPGPGIAATSDGQVVTEQDLDDIASDFARVQGAQAPTRTEMVSLLVARPFVQEAVQGSGQMLSEAGIRQLVKGQLTQVSDATVKYLQVTALQQQLDQAAVAKITKEMASADIQVDPRYGVFEPGKGLVKTPENWILPAPGPNATPAPGEAPGSSQTPTP